MKSVRPPTPFTKLFRKKTFISELMASLSLFTFGSSHWLDRSQRYFLLFFSRAKTSSAKTVTMICSTTSFSPRPTWRFCCNTCVANNVFVFASLFLHWGQTGRFFIAVPFLFYLSTGSTWHPANGSDTNGANMSKTASLTIHLDWRGMGVFRAHFAIMHKCQCLSMFVPQCQCLCNVCA